MTVYRRRIAGRIGCALALAALGFAAACGRAEPSRPDILVVVISSLRADHVSALGYARRTTPALDALAGNGTLYESAVTVTPWSPSAHATLLTGRYLSEHGVTFTHPVLEEGLDTVAEHASREGYATVAIVTDSALAASAGFSQGFSDYIEIRPEEQAAPDDGGAMAEAELVAWVRRHRKSSDAPWLAWVVLKNPSLPWNPPAEFRDRFLDSPVPQPRLERLADLWTPFARQVTFGLVTLPPEDREALISLYDAEVAYADYRLGRILEGLKSGREGENLAVFVTSDAGEDLGDHGLLADPSSLFDTILRVPLVTSWPGRIAAGGRVAEQVSTIDLPAAVLALARRDPVDPAPVEGLFRPRPVVISEAHHDPSAVAYYRSMRPEEDGGYLERGLLGVRTKDRKYLLTSQGSAALFDLEGDPGERASILETDTAKAAELSSHLAAWISTLRPPPPGAPPPPFVPSVSADPGEGAAP